MMNRWKVLTKPTTVSVLSLSMVLSMCFITFTASSVSAGHITYDITALYLQSGAFEAFSQPTLNDSNQVALRALRDNGPNTNKWEVIRGTSAGESGTTDIVSDNSGTNAQFNHESTGVPFINNSGDVSFMAWNNTIAGGNNSMNKWASGDPINTVTTVASSAGPPLAGFVGQQSMNASGQVSYQAWLDSSPPPGGSDASLNVWDPAPSTTGVATNVDGNLPGGSTYSKFGAGTGWFPVDSSGRTASAGRV